jgi:hypothetical protein
MLVLDPADVDDISQQVMQAGLGEDTAAPLLHQCCRHSPERMGDAITFTPTDYVGYASGQATLNTLRLS